MNTNKAPARFPGTVIPQRPDDIRLGMHITDRVTGLSGVAMAKVEYLTGCTQFCVQPRGLKDDGKQHDGIYLDWQRFQIEPALNDYDDLSDLGRSAATQASSGAGTPPSAPSTGLRT